MKSTFARQPHGGGPVEKCEGGFHPSYGFVEPEMTGKLPDGL
jgi:hypothetical protein